MSLTKAQRDALPASDFAVPGKRALPFHDEKHCRMAWSMLSKTQGLSTEERATARRRILSRAKTLGIDTAEWQKMAAMDLGLEGEIEIEEEPAGIQLQASSGGFQFQAASLSLEDDPAHPNKMPFSGILTRIDKPSDGAPNGSGGRRVVVTKPAAEKAIGSLLAMGINLTADLAGHDPKRKIGVITAADIDGDAIKISGHLYKADFPDEARTIKAQKDKLGFSFEADSIWVENAAADPLVITACKFTGASILLKEKAAYRTTSLAASAAGDPSKDIDMTKEEMAALLAETIKPLADRLDKIEGAKPAAVAGGADPAKIKASSEISDLVGPHADRLENCAYSIHADGLGGGAYGPTAYILGIGNDLRAQAAEGTLPMIHRDHDWPMMASAARQKPVPLPSRILANLAALVEPHAQELEEAADAMESAGVGKHPHDGHAAHARFAAHSMRAHAHRGKVAHFGPGSVRASVMAQAREQAMGGASQAALTAAEQAEAIKAAVEAAVKPLKEENAALQTKFTDLKTASFNQSTPPERKSVAPAVLALLSRFGVAAPEEGKHMSIAAMDELLDKARVPATQRIAIKRAAEHAGYLPATPAPAITRPVPVIGQ